MFFVDDPSEPDGLWATVKDAAVPLALLFMGASVLTNIVSDDSEPTKNSAQQNVAEQAETRTYIGCALFSLSSPFVEFASGVDCESQKSTPEGAQPTQDMSLTQGQSREP